MSAEFKARTAADYQASIREAFLARTLHLLAADITADHSLTAQEKYNLGIAVGLRFSELNHAAIGNPKPRWS